MANRTFPPELLQRSCRTVSGEIAWRASDVPSLLEFAAKEGRVILGGDVLTLQGVYTHDNWCYTVKTDRSAAAAVRESIAAAENYWNNYIRKNGDQFLFVLVMPKLLAITQGKAYLEHDPQ